MQITTGTDCNVHYCLASLKKNKQKTPFVWDIVRLGESVSRSPYLTPFLLATKIATWATHIETVKERKIHVWKKFWIIFLLSPPHLFTYLCSSSRQNRNLIHEAHVCIDLCTVHQKNSVSLNVQTNFLFFQWNKLII